MEKALAGRICLVAGASRGIGRGVAQALGDAGATVIVTARSSEVSRRTDSRPETIEDTARLVDEAGGRGFHYVCDHTSEREVDQLAAWALRRFGRIDLLVGCVWSGNEGLRDGRFPDGSSWGTPFWRRPTALLGSMLEGAVQAQLLTARAVAPAMVAAKKGLIVLITAADDGAYFGDIFYDLSKSAAARLAFGMAEDLKPFGVTALALAPGLARTERVMEAGLGDQAAESPLYAGRAIAALACDHEIAGYAGETLYVADLAARYGFTDIDGSQPPRFRLAINNQSGEGS
ncbi:SDR family NAD(P)-dependent oxidoreductase [Terrarubrum flagellatum]|uniref:SDR family NAD(P)-dependent oxidoreductase n=1 Tax=Terrirubrum flagellatum TaxID=2895980 RepID=UPI0031451C49